jgi:predicted DNA-binding transcriptional regulator YafY
MPARPALVAAAFVALLALGPTALPAGDPVTEQAAPAPSAAAVLLASAIREQRVVTFTYAGHARTVEPHTCGIGSTGEAILHGFQTEGGSGSGPAAGWRTFTVAKIENLVVTEHRFPEARPGYAASRPRLTPAWAELPAPAVPVTKTGD